MVVASDAIGIEDPLVIMFVGPVGGQDCRQCRRRLCGRSDGSHGCQQQQRFVVSQVLMRVAAAVTLRKLPWGT